MQIKDFWPIPAHCAECLVTEAETAAVAVFLAAHQPMRLFRHSLTTQAPPEAKTESDLLAAVLEKNLPSGTLLVPIVGNSGVGKSHMIRWLDAHLGALNDGVPRHIVRIPKNASLRNVLELILKGLPEKRYGALRRQLTSARMPPNLLEATHGLREKLLVALERAHREARARLTGGQGRPDDRERLAHCDPSSLPALLADPTVRAHFMANEDATRGVLARIAERYMQGAMPSVKTANEFTETDLEFDEAVDFAALAAATRNYLTKLNLRQGQQRKVAVAVLNSLVDNALSELHDFGGSSLSDLFVEMRKHLLADGLELVLLVEDFAALAGIQGSLLDAMIREGIYAGQRQLCVMRTVLAVTEGYLANRETVLTRARYEWRIEERPFGSEEEAVTTFTDFVGGYLNAARWGKARLVQDFDTRRHGQDDLQAWVPNFFDQHQGDLDQANREALEEFGFSPRGHHPLFPFNQGVIHQVARRHFREGETFVFNPRGLLNLLLRETLLDNRPLFEASAFPPANFQQFKGGELKTPVYTALSRRADSGSLDRLAAFVFHWGDDPHIPGEAARVPDAVYRAFALPPVKWGEKVVPIAVPEKTVPGTAKSAVARPEAPADPWVGKLQTWRESGVVSQSDANMIRRTLRDAVAEWVDWDALLIKADTLDHQAISLPKVTIGNPSESNTLAVAASDEDWADPPRSARFFAALSAVLRFHGKDGGTWNYDGGEADSAAYANFISALAVQVTDRLLKRAHSLPREALGPLAQALLVGARLLRIEGASSNNDADNLAAIFADTPPDDGASVHSADPWQQLRSDVRSQRTEARDLLRNLTVARQGGGATVQAVDISALLEAVRELRKSWRLPETLDLKVFAGHQAVMEHMRRLKDRLNPAAQTRRDALKKWREEIEGLLGAEFDINAVVEALRKTALTAHQTHVFRSQGVTYEALRDRVTKLPECRLKETLDCARKAEESEDFGTVLSALVQADSRNELESRAILKQYEVFLNATTAAATETLATAPRSIAEEGQTRALQVAELEMLWQEVEAIK